LRLRDAKTCDALFGGVAVLLLGDLMQLRPVQAGFVFGEPYNEQFKLYHAVSPLFDEFVPLNLTTNHRQGRLDKEYSEMMERIRFGEHNTDDVNTLISRVIEPSDPIISDALFICAKKMPVLTANMAKLDTLPGNSVLLVSRKKPPPSMPTYKANVEKDGCVDNTPFYDVVYIKNGARVMLTYNIDTKVLILFPSIENSISSKKPIYYIIGTVHKYNVSTLAIMEFHCIQLYNLY
jgi:hypothetical protein